MSYPATCLLGNRLNAFRLNYLTVSLWIQIGGAWTGPGTGQQILIDSLTINDRLNETPNTLIATVRGATPIEGQAIRLTIGSQHGTPLFAGTILRVTRVWAAHNPRFVLHHLEAIDPTWRLNAVLFSARYRNVSANVIAADLLTRAPAGFTGAFEPGLPVLDEISMTNTTVMDAFVQLARRIGGYTRCDYDQVVYLFRTPPTTPVLTLTATHPSLGDVSRVRDLTQVVTRAVVEGGGGNALTDVPAGATLLPVDVPGWYAPGGGFVRSGPQRLTYTGVLAGGAGAYIGSGVTPTTAPTVSAAIGASAVNAGTHSYAYTWVTAAGETLPSPIVSVVAGAAAPVPDPPPTPGAWTGQVLPPSHLTVGVTYEYAVAWTYSAGVGQSAVGRVSASRFSTCVSWTDLQHPTPSTAMIYRGYYNAGPIDPVAVSLGWYRRAAGAWYLIGVAGPEVYTPIDYWSDAELTGDPTNHPAHPNPSTGNVTVSRFTVAGIAPGPSGTTARKVYRTTAGSGQLKLLTTIANNTDTALASFDNTADASLGANAPTTDTAGLVQQTKIVTAGATDIPVTSTAPFAAAGGYAVTGNQVIRYGGVSATAMTGVPASGTGALLQSVTWGTPITAAPALVGIPATGAGAIVELIRKGDPVNLVVIVDDAPAQAALAALVGGDGVRESLLQDGRIGLAEATARGRALLEAQKQPIETVAHRARDYRTRSGELVAVDLPPPTDIHGSYRIQDVQIGKFNARDLVPPTFQAQSSSQRVSFEDLIRQIANTSAPPATGE